MKFINDFRSFVLCTTYMGSLKPFIESLVPFMEPLIPPIEPLVQQRNWEVIKPWARNAAVICHHYYQVSRRIEIDWHRRNSHALPKLWSLLSNLTDLSREVEIDVLKKYASVVCIHVDETILSVSIILRGLWYLHGMRR